MKYVIFDIDGTLADTKKVEDRCFMHAFEQTFNIDITNQKWEHFTDVTDWGITEEIIEREFGRKPHPAEYELMISNFVGKLQEEKTRDQSQFSEVNGAKDFFNELRGIENYKLGVATGSWEQSANMKLDSIRIDMDGICFSNSDYHKSREAITRDVISQLQMKTQAVPEQIIYFGDGEWDFKTCQNLGIRFIGIDIEGDGKLDKLGAQTVFRDYRNKEAILSELKKVI